MLQPPPEDYPPPREPVTELPLPEPIPEARYAPEPSARTELTVPATKKPTVQAYKEELDRQIQLKQQQKRDAVDSAKAMELQMVRNWQQEQDKLSRTKADESRKVQEQTRQFYEKQIQERLDRAPKVPLSRSSLPPPMKSRAGDVGESQPEVRPEEKSAVIESRRKIVTEMERLEKEKERVKQELLAKEVMMSAKGVDPTGFLQDVNRERFKQVWLFFFETRKTFPRNS